MDKKAKKRLEVLRLKVENLQRQLAGAKQQMDDLEEVRRFETEMANIKKEIATINNEG